MKKRIEGNAEKKAWLRLLPRIFLEKVWEMRIQKTICEKKFSKKNFLKNNIQKYKDHLRILDIGTGPGFSL